MIIIIRLYSINKGKVTKGKRIQKVYAHYADGLAATCAASLKLIT